MTCFANQCRHKKDEACGDTQDWYKFELDIEQFPNATQKKEESDHNPKSFHPQGEILPHDLPSKCDDPDAEKTSAPANVGNESYANPDEE